MSALLLLWMATATFTWAPPMQGTPDAYVVHRQAPDASWTPHALVLPPMTRYTDPRATTGCYRVTAQDATQVSVPSAVVCIRCTRKTCRQE